MVHVFSYHNKYYVYDTGSGSLHECDERTAKYLEGEPITLTDGELAEIEALRAEGLLDAPETEVRPAKPTELKALCLHICHDCNLRCSYCFDAVIEKIKKFVRARGDKHYYVRGTFTAKNLDFSKDVLFLADQGFGSLSVEPVVTEIPDLEIKKEHLPAIEKEYDALCDEYIAREKAGKGFNFFHFNVDLEGGPCLEKRVSACGAGNEYFSVVPNGDIYPCHQFAGDPKWRMGSVFGGEIDKDIRMKFATSCLFTRKKCKDCFCKFICSGGCSANNYHFNGDINEPYEITCAMMKKRVECAMRVLAARKSQEI